MSEGEPHTGTVEVVVETKNVDLVEVKIPTTTITSPDRLDILITSLDASIKGDLSALNIVNVCISAMQIVESFPKMKGNEKKQLVLAAIEKLIQKYGQDNALLSLLPSFIDEAIQIEKGKVVISVDKGCLSKCFGCL
jgi:hypothetical protein